MNTKRKGIVLSGGKGTRLGYLTRSVSKQLHAVYDKPMVFYPMSLLMLAGIDDILIISDPTSLPLYENLFKDGSEFGIKVQYAEQKEANGLAQAFVIGKDFIGNSPVALVLGDNIFYGASLTGILKESNTDVDSPQIFAYMVKDPRAYGVVEISNGKAISIEEKPQNPKSNYAVPGIYFYPNSVVEIAENIKPSKRGEYEITDVNREYMNRKELKVRILPRGIAWLDSGTPSALNDASNFVRTIQDRTGISVADLRQIGFDNGWIQQSTK